MSAETRDELLAFTENKLTAFTGVSRQRLRRWDKEFGLVKPGIKRQLSPRSTVRLYDFRDAVEPLVVKELLARGRSLHQIRRLVRFLREQGYEKPLSELRYAVPTEKESKEIYIQHPDGTWVGDRAPNHIVIHEVLRLEEIRNRVRRAAEQPRERVGEVEKVRGRRGSKVVFAGTRIPLDVVIDYLREGCPDSQILEEFPALTTEDLKLARAEFRKTG